MKKQLEVWHLMLSLGLVIIGIAVSGGMSYQKFETAQEEIRLLKAKDQSRDQRDRRIEYYLVRIGEKLGVRFDLP